MPDAGEAGSGDLASIPIGYSRTPGPGPATRGSGTDRTTGSGTPVSTIYHYKAVCRCSHYIHHTVRVLHSTVLQVKLRLRDGVLLLHGDLQLYKRTIDAKDPLIRVLSRSATDGQH